MPGLLPNDVSSDLPSLSDLPTPMERTAYVLGRMLDSAPKLAQPVLRSLLLPRLATLDSVALTEALDTLRNDLLPWLIDGSRPGEPTPVPVEPVQDTSGRALSVRGEDGLGENDTSRQGDTGDGLPDGSHRPEAPVGVSGL